MKKHLISLLILITIIICGQSIYAHFPEVIELEGTEILFQFDTGDPMHGANLIVEYKDGNIIHEGFVSKDGIFDYSDYIDKGANITVSDNSGHSIDYIIPEVDNDETSVPLNGFNNNQLIIITAVILIAIFIWKIKSKNK